MYLCKYVISQEYVAYMIYSPLNLFLQKFLKNGCSAFFELEKGLKKHH